MKIAGKAMKWVRDRLLHLINPRISEAKVEEAMYWLPHRKVMDGSNFDDTLNALQESTSGRFQGTTDNLLAICTVQTDKYAMLVADMLEGIEPMERNMARKRVSITSGRCK
jgi:hypothetical protein